MTLPRIARSRAGFTTIRWQQGFTLVEVVGAIVLLAAILVSLAGLSYHAARQAINPEDGVGRHAVELDMVNIMTSMPWDSMNHPANGCDTVRAPGSPYRYRRCLEVTTPAERRVTITVAVTPLRAGSYVQRYPFDRAAPPPSNPLFVP